MAQGMRADFFVQAYLIYIFIHDLPDTAAGEPLSPTVKKDSVINLFNGGVGHKPGPRLGQIFAQRANGLRTYRDEPFPGPFPHHPDISRTKIQIPQVKQYQLVYSQATRIQCFQQGPVTPAQGMTHVGRLHQKFYFPFVQKARQPLFKLRAHDFSHRVLFNNVFPEQVTVKRAPGRKPPGYGSAGKSRFPQ
jgi:hypothetical protein